MKKDKELLPKNNKLGPKSMKTKSIFLALAILASFLACQCKENKVVSDELAGVWKTSAPKYKDCFFELNEHLVIFVNGNLLENIDINFISKIKSIHKKRDILYNIYYENLEGQEFKLSFYYDPSDGGTITFKNQEKIEWRKGNYPKHWNLMFKISCGKTFLQLSMPDLRRKTTLIVNNELG